MLLLVSPIKCELKIVSPKIYYPSDWLKKLQKYSLRRIKFRYHRQNIRRLPFLECKGCTTLNLHRW